MDTQPILQTADTKADLELGSLGGVQRRLILVPFFKNPEDKRNSGPIEGSRGAYKVIFSLQRPGFSPLPEYGFFLGGSTGDSHLKISKPIAQRQPTDRATVEIATFGDSFRMKFIGYPNDGGYLGRIEVELDAETLYDAQDRAHRALATSLSTLSAQLEVPLCIQQIDSTELSTGRVASLFTVPFAEQAFHPGGLRMTTPEFRFYASLYREALCSNSRIYQFLCLFKIIEGVRRRRTRLGALAKKRKEKFQQPPEVLPNGSAECRSWLEGLFQKPFLVQDIELDAIIPPESRGRKFGAIIDQPLGRLRNSIAHSLSSDPGELRLLADELLHLDQVERWLPLTRCIVRQMLKNEFPTEFLSGVSSEGTQSTASGPIPPAEVPPKF